MEKPQPRAGDGAGDLAIDRALAGTDAELIVVSNRQPYRHEYGEDGETITVDRPAGGVTAGLDAVLRDAGGRWIAWGDGDADAAVVDDRGRVSVPPDDPSDGYTLERLWLTDEQVDNYYYGFSNRVLWPVCHSALTEIDGNGRFWEHYSGVNERFAEAVAADVAPGSVVWFHDYHLALAPRRVRTAVPDDALLVHTWHVPWPSWDVFRSCPHRRELLRGLLGNDVVGFHVPRYCENFLRCVSTALPDARVDWEDGRVTTGSDTTLVRAFPMGVPADRINRRARSDEGERFWREFADRRGLDAVDAVGVGVDRLDYSKGLVQRIAALERLWESNPRWRESFSYVQVATETRSKIEAYGEYQESVEAAVERVNDRFGTEDWTPIAYTTEMIPDEALAAIYAHADVAIVSPIRDGMNLVAQEYVAAQQDDDAVLVLSDQAGVHDQVHDWVLSISPHDVVDFAERIHEALTLPVRERRSRMKSLRRYVATNDVDEWLNDVFGTVAALRESTVPERRQARV